MGLSGLKTAGLEWLWAPLVIAVALGMALWDAIGDYREAHASSFERMSALARVVEARTVQTFQAVDLMLLDVAKELGAEDQPGDPQMHRYLTARARIRSDALTATVVGADGTIRHSSVANLVGRNVGDRSYLTHFRTQPEDDSLFIGEPVTALLNRQVVFAARAVRNADGTLRAVVVAALSPDLFAGILDAVVPSEATGAVSLANRGHIILARLPEGQAIGQSLAEAPLMLQHLAAGGIESRLEGVGGVDGVPRLIAVRTIKPYDFTVGVSVAKDEVTEPVIRGLMGRALFLLAVVVVTVPLYRLSLGRERARAEAERQTARARDHYMRILDHFPALVRRTNADGRCVYVNQTWLDFTGRSFPEEVGEGWLMRLPPEDRAIAEKPGNDEREYRLLCRDGSCRWVRELRHAFIDADGNPDGVLSACLDITEAKQVQQQLQNSNAELEQFAYVASHDLREPLRMIGSYIALIERRLGASADQDIREFLAFAKDGAVRMDQLVLDLLQFSRIGRMSSPARAVDANEALATALAQLGLLLSESKAILCVGQLPMVTASESDLVRLFQNLVGNAVKYARPGVPPRITIEAQPSESGWSFSVADNGIGIDPQYFERIFRIFQRLHARDAHGGGSGIGLAICKKVVEYNGGRIWVESPGPDQGATIHFTLPGASALRGAAE
ncbi:ATP-binding protein [Magnetospirillum sp. UT-4]|uniref:ATP-binding protein n=1 Tax=Magnetospirillum sp. UT-4 TaxID=2681467 RepID=UPI001573806C|nr:ATP-binding protein [Magnetospirillum sp. UT-4]